MPLNFKNIILKSRLTAGFFCAIIIDMGKKSIIFYTTLLLLLLAYALNASFLDFDLWARLIAGMGVIDGGHVLTEDFLSYTPVHTWYDHEWGAGVIFYAFLKLFGHYGILLLQVILPFLTFFVATRVTKIRTGTQPYNLLFYFFCLMAAMSNLNHPVRCHLFSFLFFALFIYILEKVRHGKSPKLLILLPFLTILWNNIHGGVVAGLGLIGMYIVGEIYNRKPFKNYIYALIASCAVLTINPWGFEYIKFLLTATTMNRPLIVEWQGLFSDVHRPYQIIFKMFLCAVAVIELLNLNKAIKNSSLLQLYQKADKVKWIVLLVTAYLSITHIKMLPFFCVAVACYCYEDLAWIFQKVNEKAVYILLIGMSLYTIAVKQIELPINFSIYPVAEVEFLKVNNIKGNILVDFGIGSFASYKLYPDCKIYMDGRYEEVYPDELLTINDRFYATKGSWDDVLYKYPPDIILIQNNLPVYKLMLKKEGWHRIYEGSVFAVFVNDKLYTGNYKMPSLEREYYKKTLFDTDIKFTR